MIKLAELSSADTIEDVEKKSALRTIQVVVYLTFAGALVAALNSLAAGNYDSAIWLVVGALLLIAPFWLAKGGRLNLAGLLVLSIFLVVITYVLHDNGGIHNVGIALYPILLLVASLMLKRRGLASMTLLTILATGLLAGGEYLGWFTYPPVTSQVLLTDWISLVIILIATAFGVGLWAQDSRESLRRAHQELADRKQAEEALQLSEARYRALVETSPDAITLTDLEGKVLVCNQQTAVMHGYEKAEMLKGMHADDFLAPEERERAAQYMALTYQQGAVRNLEYIFQKCHGERFYGELSSSVVSNDDGKPIAFMAISRDITERKRIEKALKDSEEKFRLIADNFSVGIFILQNEQFRYMGREGARLMGYEQAELIGHPFMDFVYPEERQRVGAFSLQRLSGGKAPDNFETRLLKKDGSIIEVLMYSTLIEYEGKPATQGAFFDITERKRVEKAISESEQRYSEMIRNLRDGFCMVDTDGRITRCNPAFEKIVGYTQDELKPMNFIKLTVDKWREAEARILLDQALTRGYTDLYEKEYYRKDGSIIPVELTVYLVRDRLGGPAGFLSFIRDITERKQAEEALKRSQQMFSTLFRANPAATIFTSLSDGKCVDANEAFIEQLGYQREELIGKTLDELGIWPSKEEGKRLTALFTQQGHIDHIELSLKKKNGDWITVISGGEAIHLEGLGYLLAFYIDITARKRVEEALRASEKKFHRIIEQSADAIILADEEGRVIEWNRGAEQVLGLKREEALGLPAWEVQFRILPEEKQTPEALESIKRHVEKVLRLGTSTLSNTQEIEIQHPDGLHRMIQPATFTMGTTNGHMIGTIIRDITQRKRAEEDLRQANEKLMVQLEEIRKLHADLSEQAVRDPLTGLFNRRYLTEVLEHEMARAKREGYPISFVMADIDHFKQLNDTYGHPVGDLMLQDLAEQLRVQTRASDILFRFGGDEFLMVLLNTTTESAQQCAERCRMSFQATRLNIASIEVRSTLSLGVATYPMHGKLSKEILAASDQALYMAKTSGRNRIVVWKAPLTEET